MVATREKWETESSLPRGASYDQLLEFFGIPPYTAEALDDNISKKRRYWNHKSNGGNPTGRQKAADVLALIQRVSQALKRGARVPASACWWTCGSVRTATRPPAASRQLRGEHVTTICVCGRRCPESVIGR